MRSSPLDAARDATAAKAALAGMLLGLLAPWLGACVARAAGPPVTVAIRQASGQPATYFTLHARAGQLVKAGLLTVSNLTGHAVRVSIDPVNGLTASSLGSTYAMASSPPRGSTRWLRLGVRQLVIPPRASSSVDVAVRVPEAAAPGEYLSGVAVEAQEGPIRIRPAGGIEIGQVYRYAIGVETRVPGALERRVGLTGARVERYPGSVVFVLLASNDGNAILQDVHGSVSVTEGARQVLARTIPPGTFVSHTSIQLPESAPREQPSASTVYHVRAALMYEGKAAQLDTNVTFGTSAAALQALYTHPRHSTRLLTAPLLGGLLGGLVLLAGGAAWLWRRLARGSRVGPIVLPTSDSTPGST